MTHCSLLLRELHCEWVMHEGRVCDYSGSEASFHRKKRNQVSE